MIIPLLVLTAFLLLSVLSVIAMLVVRPHYRHGYRPSPDSKVTPLGMYRKRVVRTRVTRTDIRTGIERAREREYWNAFFADPDVQAEMAQLADESRETEEGGFAVEEDGA